ncbi:MAG: sugar transferase [bacterium]|nr:sugar transferase [bacterium]
MMRRRFLWAQALLDGATLAVAMGLASLVNFGTPFPWLFEPQVVSLLAIMFAGLAVAEWTGSMLLVGNAPRPSYGRALVLALIVLGSTSLALIATRVYFSRPLIGWTMALFLLGALGHRALHRRRPWMESMVLVTDEKGLVDDLRNSPHANVVSVLDPGTRGRIEPLAPGLVLGIDFKSVLSDRMAQYVSSCTLAGYDVRPLSRIYETHTGRMPLVALAEGWELSAPVLRAAPYLPGKRIFDIAAVLVAAPLTMLIGAGAALTIRLSSPGPVIFRQTRIGRGGTTFTQYKFRSMWDGSDHGAPSFTREKDDRIIPMGRVLRRLRVDEIPQLWNVLKGDMSLVGPRPEQVEFVERFSRSIPFYSHRHMVRPGVTGWAQVNYGYADDEADTIDKLTYDLFYLKHMSPWLDLEILGRSFWTVLSGFGAR